MTVTHLTPAVWRKSSHSGNDGACVEVASASPGRLVRDSKLGERSPVLSVPVAEFGAFLDAVRAGRLG